MTLAQAGAKLRGLVKGRFRSIKVLQRGFSPRVVRAQIIGTKGATNVTGADLRRRFGLFDSWAYYTTITSTKQPTTTPAAPAADGSGQGDPATGGTAPTAPAGTARAGHTVLSGTITPAQRGAWLRVQRNIGGRWFTYAWTTTDAHGRYRARLNAPGVYRVLFQGNPGPEIRA
jgi:stage II sporulation protein D